MIDIRHITTIWHSAQNKLLQVSQLTCQPHIFRQFIVFTHLLTDPWVSTNFLCHHTDREGLRREIQNWNGRFKKDTWKNGAKVKDFFALDSFLPWHNIHRLYDITFTFTSTYDIDTCLLPISLTTTKSKSKKKKREQFYDLWEKPINYPNFFPFSPLGEQVVNIFWSSHPETNAFCLWTDISWTECVIAWQI